MTAVTMNLWKEEALKAAEYRLHQEWIQMQTNFSLFFGKESYQDPLFSGLHRDPPKEFL